MEIVTCFTDLWWTMSRTLIYSSSATFGTTSEFKGNILAMQSITFNTGASLDGRALARIGGIILAGNTIVKK